MYSNNKVAKAVRIAMMFGAGAATAISAPVLSAEEDGAEKVERIEVTGSRIKRTDLESASPIQIMSFDDIKDEGRLSVADALRNVTGNTFSSAVPSSGSGQQSQSTVSLLGAGSGRTLVLVDGKRLAGSPSLGGSSANLSSIPLAAVERIEILKDGASAVYGSDAIAGVVNIILKKDFEGVAFDASFGRPTEEGSDTKSMSLTFGMNSERGNITFVYDHERQGAIFDRDREYTAPDFTTDKNGDGLVSLYSETVGVSYFGATIEDPTTGNLYPSAKCSDLVANVPGFVGELDQGPFFGDGTGKGKACAYAYSLVSANSASTQRDSLMTNVHYDITDDITLFARGMYSRNDSFGRYAPPAATWSNIPADNEHNPLDVEADGFFRWYGIGNRDTNITDFQQDLTIGLKGSLGDTAEWEFSFQKAKLDYRDVGRSYLSYAGLAYNEQNGISLGSDEGVANISQTTYRENTNNFEHYFGGLAFELGELSGGVIQHYVGAEYFDQVYASKFDKQSEANLVGGSAGNTAEGARSTKAAFYEIALPFTDELLVSGAIRYDRYSDFGSKSTPSVKFEYRPMDDLLVRGSWGKGFRAPSLSALLGQDSVGHPRASDYVLCKQQGTPVADCGSRQIENLHLSNDKLGAEESTYINVGFVYSGVDNLSVKLDYFDLEVDNVISTITVQDLINAEVAGVLDDLEAKYNVNLDRKANGSIDGQVQTTSANGAFLSRKGFDLEASYLIETGFGEFKLNSATTYLTEVGGDVFFSGPTQDYAGFTGQPEWRSKFTASYALDDLNISWTVDAIASTYEDDSLQEVSPNVLRNIGSNHNASYVTHNLNIAYHFGDYGRVTVGARNVFNKGVLKDDNNEWINDTLYNAGHIGRDIYAGYSIKF